MSRRLLLWAVSTFTDSDNNCNSSASSADFLGDVAASEPTKPKEQQQFYLASSHFITFERFPKYLLSAQTRSSRVNYNSHKRLLVHLLCAPPPQLPGNYKLVRSTCYSCLLPAVIVLCSRVTVLIEDMRARPFITTSTYHRHRRQVSRPAVCQSAPQVRVNHKSMTLASVGPNSICCSVVFQFRVPLCEASALTRGQ